MNINYELIDTTAPAPEQEPERQRYFIAKCREIIKERELEIGRKLTFYDQTFGCQMNFKDSEKLNGILEDIGYVKADTEKADFVYYNTCTVRENANVRVYGRLGALKNYKKKNPEMVIAMCGCMMQEPEEQEKVKTTFKFVDVVFGTHNIFKLAELLYECLSGRKRVFDVWEKTDQIIEDLPSDRKFGFKAGVNIMFGCNNFCSYCIVPYVRGRERSRKPEDIVAEVKKLASDTKKLLEGCKLQIIAAEDIKSEAKLGEDDQKILYKKGKVIEEFSSRKTSWKKEKFPAGKYILHEVSCPKKYKLAKDVKFTIKKTSKLQTVVMIDELQIGTIDTNIPHSGREDKNTNVKTGDQANPLLSVILLAGSAALVLYIKKRQGKEEEDEEAKEKK